MKGFAIRRKLAMLVAAVVTVVGVGTMQGSSATGDPRAYWIFNYETETETSSYELDLSEQYGTSTYSVFPPDEREEYGNSGIVFLESIGMGKIHRGTGFIVGDHTIVTAAHCVFEKNDDEERKTQGLGNYLTNLTVTLYDASGNKLGSPINATETHVPDLYKTCTYGYCVNYDYALITVEEDLSDHEHFKLGEVLNAAAGSTAFEVKVAGFPGREEDENDNIIYSGEDLYISSGTLTDLNTYRVSHNADTTAGQSGSPIFVESIYAVGTDVYYLKTVIGIHTHGGNRGVRMTPEVRQFYLNNPNI